MKLRTITAGAAIAGALSVGLVGVAGAASPGKGHAGAHQRIARIEAVANAGALPANFNCSTAATKLARIQTVQSKIATRMTTAEGRESAATAAGDTARATEIANRISKAQTFQADLGTVANLITAKCG
jgi:hypothetical protein